MTHCNQTQRNVYKHGLAVLWSRNHSTGGQRRRFKTNKLCLPCWCIGLRTQCCPCSGCVCCSGMGSISSPGSSTPVGRSQEKNKRMEEGRLYVPPERGHIPDAPSPAFSHRNSTEALEICHHAHDTGLSAKCRQLIAPTQQRNREDESEPAGLRDKKNKPKGMEGRAH